ncbi:hypothetical protein [Zhongshania sp.]|uniref:hypothetical protein n=1 Tax=Zhongshania sp. TaxID=1971902 RepID=UPI00356A695B
MAVETFTNFRKSTDPTDRGGFGAENIFALKVLNASATKDPVSLVDGAGETLSFTVTGAALGDFVMVAAPYDLQDLTVTGYVSAADTVEVRIQNESTATVDLASGTWKIKVIHDGE